MGQKKKNTSVRQPRPHPLNLLYTIYDESLEPAIPLERFAVAIDDAAVFEKALQANLLPKQKDMIEYVCCQFVNTAAFQAHRASAHDLAEYTRDIAETSDRLAGLLLNPEKIRPRKGGQPRPNYPLIQSVLLNNWPKTNSELSLEKIHLVFDQLRRLTNDLLRISADHAPRRFDGPHPDLALNYLLLYLRSIVAGTPGQKVTLPANEDRGYSTELRDFALAVLAFAIERGKRAIESLNLSEIVRADAHAALDKYSQEVNPTRLLRLSENWYVKPQEKREKRRKKADTAHSPVT